MEQIIYNIKERTEKIQSQDNLGFGNIFTDHVFEMDYSENKGWHNPAIKPLSDLQMHPATMFIHYGQAIFEGLKAYKTVNGEVVIFRPDQHIQRLNNSARRICIPEVDNDFLLTALKELINIERDWIPTNQGESLYIRPFIYGNDPFLGVKPANAYKLIILLSPVGAYYPEGFKPVKILAQDDYVRAVRKGLGECKTPANYAASLLAGEEAMKKGYTQVLWLDGVTQRYIEEVGTMNIFINMKDEIVTPKLNGSILPGITRDSVLKLSPELGYEVGEEKLDVYQVLADIETGKITEVFGCGTAAVISPVGMLYFKGKQYVINNNQSGPVSRRLYDELTGIQYGVREDRFGWVTTLDED